MKKHIFILFALCLGCLSLQAQEKKYYTAEEGKWAVGVTFNPASLGGKLAVQPAAGSTTADYILQMGGMKQMFIMSQDPIAAIRVKRYMAKNWALRAAVGINGSLINHREYITDDLAKSLNPDSQNKVADCARSSMNSFSLNLGAEFSKGNKAIRFVYGFDLVYSVAGGALTFDYGNIMSSLNPVPSTMPMTGVGGDLNDFKPELGITYARPVEKRNVNSIHGLGISADAGIEIFLNKNLSISAAMNFTPVMMVFQPDTYTVYEGYSSYTGKVEKVNGLTSPGSMALLYGIENIGCRISLSYYL